MVVVMAATPPPSGPATRCAPGLRWGRFLEYTKSVHATQDAGDLGSERRAGAGAGAEDVNNIMCYIEVVVR